MASVTYIPLGFAVIVAEHGPLTLVFNFSPFDTLEACKVLCPCLELYALVSCLHASQLCLFDT